jgi:hypothetical protein
VGWICLYVIDSLRLISFVLTWYLLGILREIGVSDCCSCLYGESVKRERGLMLAKGGDCGDGSHDSRISDGVPERFRVG